MKKLLCILLLISTFTLTLTSCLNTGPSEEEIAAAVEELNTKYQCIQLQGFILGTVLERSEIEKMYSSSASLQSYYEACDEYRETLDDIKDTIDYYKKNSACFDDKTHEGIVELEEIYNDSLSRSESISTSNRTGYTYAMNRLVESIETWATKYVSS